MTRCPRRRTVIYKFEWLGAASNGFFLSAADNLGGEDSGCPIPSTSLRAGSLRFSKDGILCGLHPTDFFFPLLTI